MSLRIKAMLAIIAIVFVFTVASFFSGIFIIRQNLTKDMEQNLLLSCGIADSLVSTNINLLVSDARTVAERLLKVSVPEEMQAIMDEQRQIQPIFTALTVYDPSNISQSAGVNYLYAHSGSNIPHDIFFNEYKYINVALKGESIFTTTHTNSASGEFVMHLFMPMGQNGDGSVKYVLSATIPGMYFFSLLRDYKFEGTGNMLVMDDNGTFIAHSEESYVIMRKNFVTDDWDDSSLNEIEKRRELFRKILNFGYGRGGVGIYYRDKIERICAYKRISVESCNWHIITVIPVGESALSKVQKLLIVSSLLLLGAGVLASVFVSKYAAKPFNTIREQAAQIKNEAGELERRDNLLHAVNEAAGIMLATEGDKNFENSLLEGMEIIGRCMDIDRVFIMQNETIDGDLHFSYLYRWINNENQKNQEISAGQKFSYNKTLPGWEKYLLEGDRCINGAVSTFTPDLKEYFEHANVKSILIIPIFIQDNFWGLVSFGDFENERVFTKDKVDILRSGALMMVNVLNRNEQAAQIKGSHEQTALLLDAMPFMCCVWDRNINIFICNEESVRMFGTKNKQDFADNFGNFSPEYQPDGQLSSEKSRYFIKKAFEDGSSVFEWLHQKADGTPIPAEVVLVRIVYDGNHAVAAYVRDLREHKKMMDEIEQRDNLLNTVNEAATVLLTMEDNEKFEETFLSGMEHVGKCINIDRVQIWQNETIDGEQYFVQKFIWLSETGRQKTAVPAGTKFPYSSRYGWYDKFMLGECINAPLSELSQGDRDFLNNYEIKSVVVIPLFLQNRFWGFFSIDDCVREQVFSDEELNILRSASLMMANAVNRNMQAKKIRETHGQTTLLIDAMPFMCSLWDKNGNIFICSEESVRLFGLNNKQEFIDNFGDFSPEYQPDGQRSREMAICSVTKAFEEGRCVFEWLHQKKDGTPIPTEVTLVRVAYDGDYVVAGYLRDLREHKKMMEEIERRDYLLNVVNEASGILLQSEIEHFEKDLHYCMSMLAQAISSDRISIWKNHVHDGKLYYSQMYEYFLGTEYTEDKEGHYSVKEPRCYSERVPTWEGILSKGNCINTLVRDLPSGEREHLAAQGILSVFITPVFMKDYFWGFVGYDSYYNEKVYTETEQIILHSGGLLITNALQRNEMMLEINKANNAKSAFLANMSHEMRTPLNAIIGLSELTLGNEDLNEESYSNIEKINNAGQTLLGTVNDILDISKIEAGKFELLPIEYEMSSLINDTITLNILRIGEKPIEFVLDISEDLPARLYGDELRVKMLLNNILSNAFKYTREGTVTLGISCLRDGEDAMMTAYVRDSGIGIKPGDINTLFDAYGQVDMNANRNIEGTGLGLPLTRKLAQMMGGNITVESEYGKGSVFTIKIRQKFVTDAVIGKEVVENLKGFRYSDHKRKSNFTTDRIKLPYAKVLVVDDNQTNLDVARGMMKPYNMQIDCLSSGQAAIDAIRREAVKYNAVFMDHMMPGMDGIEATRRIRELGTDYAKNLTIIALTANAIAGNEQMFLNNGFQAFLTKPIIINRLDEVIRHWIRDEEQEKDLPNETANAGQSTEKTGGFFQDKKIDGLDLQKGLQRFGGDEELFSGILRSWAGNTRSLLEQVKTVNTDNLADYATTVHGIKGSSRGIGVGLAGNLAEDLEKAAKTGDFEFVQKNNTHFIQTVEKLITDVVNMLSLEADKNQKPKKDKPDSELLSKLLAACQAYDIDEVDEAAAELESFEYTADSGLALWLKDKITQGKLSEIVKRLSQT